MKKNALIVYGSLMNRQELLSENIDSSNMFPVIVKGYKRSFSQEPSYRLLDSQFRGVLRVCKDEKSFLNAILIPIDIKDFNKLDEREKGYNRTLVHKNSLDFKYKKFNKDFDDIYIYIGKEEKFNKNIYPNKNYLDICLEGTKTWSLEFYNDFLESTYVKDETLKSYLNT